MPARHRSRQRALQVLYLWDQRHQPIQEAIGDYYETLHSEEENAPPASPDPFMESLATGVVKDAGDIDGRITRHSQNWRMERMAAVDRNILRVAVFEMTVLGTPGPVVIDEAIELAREFSGDDSVSFINGVLDAIYRGIRGQPAKSEPGAPPVPASGESGG